MNAEKEHASNHTRSGDRPWAYLLTGYVVGFAAVRLLIGRIEPAGKIGAFVSGLGLGMTGGSPGEPWRA
jgi:hypothetical protein